MTGLLSTTTIDSIAKRTADIRVRFENNHEDLTVHQMRQMLADLDRLIHHANLTVSRWTAIRMAVDGETTTRAKR